MSKQLITKNENRFAARLRRCESEIIQRFVEEICHSRRADLLSTLTYEQLVSYIPEIIEELARAFEADAGAKQVAHHARNLRSYAQTRFQQNCLIDESLRELMILRGVFEEAVWDDADKILDGRKKRTPPDESASETESELNRLNVKQKQGSVSVTPNIYEVRDALRRTGRFFDELVWQTAMIYAASQRPPVPTRTASWHLPLLLHRESTEQAKSVQRSSERYTKESISPDED